MQGFYTNARVSDTADGLYFYEKDILMSNYLFKGNVEIDITLKYEHSGFGVLILEDNEAGAFDSNHKYLFHLGTNRFKCVEKHITDERVESTRTNVLSPSLKKDTKLKFVMKNKKVTFYWITNAEGVEEEKELGTHKIKRKFSKYYIGFYSQAYNTIKEISFLQGIPNNWHTSIRNVHGGRISFDENLFKFENHIHDAEIEQRNLLLPKGEYWFSYKKELVNGINDIEGFIYPAVMPNFNAKEDIDKKLNKVPVRITDKEKNYEIYKDKFEHANFHDEGKNLLDEKGHFELSHDTEVVVSFKGTQGIIKNLSLRDTEKGDFIATGDKPLKIDGSWITVDLTGLSALRWEGAVYQVPEWEDYTQECPYGLISTVKDKVTIESVFVDLNKWYNYNFTVDTRELKVSIPETSFATTRTINITEKDKNKIKLFFNIKAEMMNLILVFLDGSEINVNIQKTYKKSVPGYIQGPIIVTNEDNESFELSSCYREVLKEDKFIIDTFESHLEEMRLSRQCTNILNPIKVYGLNKSVVIDNSPGASTNINDYTEAYTEINIRNYKLKNNIVTVDKAIRNDYAYIAVKYQTAENFDYIFTTYNRELFAGTEEALELAKPLNESGQGITVYGIPAEANFIKDYFFRTPNKDMTESIDLCTDLYEMISPTYYHVDVEEAVIKLSKEYKDKFKYYIVNYMMNDSYAVNWDEKYQQYEVTISTDEPIIKVHYEMDEDGISSRTIKTGIKTDESKFIILRRKKGEFTE